MSVLVLAFPLLVLCTFGCQSTKSTQTIQGAVAGPRMGHGRPPVPRRMRLAVSPSMIFV